MLKWLATQCWERVNFVKIMGTASSEENSDLSRLAKGFVEILLIRGDGEYLR